MTIFALELSTLEALRREQRSPTAPSAVERFNYLESQANASNSRVTAGTAEISVAGVLTKEPDLLMKIFFGNTAYSTLTRDLDAAEGDPAVKRVVLNVDSPGGEVDGLFQLMDRISSFSKPIVARADAALSAAYGIAASANRIEATHASSRFGSVGVAASIFTSDRVVNIASTDAPDKRPDPKTSEGQATIRKHLDDVHALFAAAIARGRGTTVAKVNQDFGRGGVVLAAAAKKAGMIDSIASSSTKRTTSASAQKALANMRPLSDLRASNPTLYDEFTAICGDDSAQIWREIQAEAMEEDLQAERARCVAHIEAATAAGDPMLAFDAVETGAPFDAAAMQRYTQAAMDAPQWRGGRLVSGGELPQSTSAPDVGDFIVSEMLRRRGKTTEADALASRLPEPVLSTQQPNLTDAQLKEEIVRLMAEKGRGR